RALSLAIVELRGDRERRAVRWLDHAHRARAAEVRVAPGDRRTHRFAREAAAVRPGRERPTGFGCVAERGLDLALEVREADFADEAPRRLLAHDPITEAEQRPVSDVAQQAKPRLGVREGFAADVARHVLVAPHRRALVEVLERVPRESQTFRLERRR